MPREDVKAFRLPAEEPIGVDLGAFRNPEFDRGAGRLKEFLWLLTQWIFFDTGTLPLFSLRYKLLRAFGARIAREQCGGFGMKPHVHIKFPWKLTVGRNCWIGEGVRILNLAPVTIGDNVCISQGAFLCTGSHDWSDPHFGLITQPIEIGDGAWICANTFVGPGVKVGRLAVATAGSVVTRDLPPGMICSGNPCVPVKRRVIRAGGLRAAGREDGS